MSYANVTNQKTAGYYKRGGIYLARTERVIENINDLSKTDVMRIGGVSASRPLLVLREPEEWDIYKSCVVCTCTTRPVPKIRIPVSKITEYGSAPDQHDTYAFKCHDVRTVSADILGRYIGQVPDSLMNLILLICDALNTIRPTNIVAILQELKVALKAYPEHRNDIASAYYHAYSRYPEIVEMSAPELAPQNVISTKAMANLPNATIKPPVINNKPTSATPVKLARDMKNNRQLKLEEFKEEEPKPEVKPEEKSVEPEPVEEVKEAEEPKAEEKPEENTNPIPNDSVLFVLDMTQSYEKVPVVRKEMSLTLDEAIYLCAAGYLPYSKILSCFKTSTNKIYTGKKEYAHKVNTNQIQPYTLTPEYMNLFRSWLDSRELSGVCPTIDLCGHFPMIAENIMESLPEKVDFKDVDVNILQRELGVERYGDIPNSIRSAYYKLTAAELYEVVPVMSNREVSKYFHLRLSDASQFMKLAALAYKIATNTLEENPDNETTEEIIADAKSAKMVAEENSAKMSKEEKDAEARAKAQEIKYWLSPRNIKMMPPKIRDQFLTIPKKFIEEIARTMAGWDIETFGVEYGTVKKMYEAQKKIEQQRLASAVS